MPKQDIDPRILALCDKVTAKRPRTVIDHIIEHGSVTTEELQTIYGYDHPPRAIRDVRECGIPLETFRVISEKTGRSIAAYRFDNPNKIMRGRIGGRRAFSKRFRDALLERYGARDAITGERCEARYLQIDHRVPYEVAGESSHHENRPEAYMLLDASSQRAKSWSASNARTGERPGTRPCVDPASGHSRRDIPISPAIRFVVWILNGADRRSKPSRESGLVPRKRTRR